MSPNPLLTGGERRTLSVLVLDFAGSTALTARLDPEDFEEILQRLGSMWFSAIEEFGGSVLKWTGDGLMAVFGYPQAHDNDAVRAVAAGLRVLEVTERERATGRQTPAVRIGLHTGLTLIHRLRTGDAVQLDIAGDTPAIATRLEGLAPLNGMVVSAVTARLAEREFEFESLGPQTLKGLDEPFEVTRVVGRRVQPLEVAEPRIFGRSAQLQLLEESWQRASAGERVKVLVRATAGGGKSRLVVELGNRLEGAGHDVVFLHCSELMRTTAFHPLIRGLHVLLDWKPGDPEEGLRERIAAEFDDLPIPAVSSLVAALLGLPADPAISTLDPGRRRALQLQAMVSWVERRARQAPCCLVVEDLHWADPSTLEFLAMLMQSEEPLPLLLLMTSRTGEEPAQVNDPGVATVDLEPLSRDDAIALVAEIADGQLPAELTDEILERSDAVPLFVCELTRAVVQSGVVERGPHGYELRGELDSGDVPTSLRDSLMMRLDGLGRLRALASIAATIGRTFDVELLREVAETGDVDDELDQMVAAGVLVRAEGQTDRRLYTFGHALVREAAYHSITKRTRRQWHGRIADALADRADAEATMQAHHLTEAGRFAEAVDMWATAARIDFANAAYDESIAHYERGLALISQLEPEEAAAREFGLRLGVGLAYATRIGYASREAEQSYQRANELAQALTGPEGFPAVLGLWAYYQVRSDPVQRRELGVRCHALSQLVDEVAIRLEGLSALSTTLGFEGEFDAACELMTEGIELFDRTPDAELTFFMPQHPVAGFCAISGPLLWARGELRAALERYERCRQFAEQPTGVYGYFTSGYAHTFGSWLCGLRGDYEGAAAHAQAAMAVASEHGFLVWMGAAVPHLGIATAMLGDTETGIGMIRQGIDGWHGVGSALFVSYWQHGLGLAYEAAGDLDKALEAVDAGIDHSERHAERFHLAELHRLRARLLAARGDDEAARDWRLAAEVARGQGARLFELLALSDLAAAGAIDDLERARLEELAKLLDEELRAVPTSPALLRSASWG